jgi:hypothetical protein
MLELPMKTIRDAEPITRSVSSNARISGSKAAACDAPDSRGGPASAAKVLGARAAVNSEIALGSGRRRARSMRAFYAFATRAHRRDRPGVAGRSMRG